MFCSPPLHRMRGGTAPLTTLALTAASAVGLCLAGTAPAHAAAAAWDPAAHSLPWVPAPSVDGEISVTSLDSTGLGTITSFTRTGTPVTYANSLGDLRDGQWGPAGDVLSATDTGKSDIDVIGPSGETVRVTKAPMPVQWTPFGDGQSAVSGSSGSFAPRFIWTGDRTRSQTVTATSPTVDPGAAAVTPNADSMVISMAGDSGNDLGIQESPLPLNSNPALRGAIPAATALGYAALAPHDPAVAPDGTLAFVGDDGSGPGLFVDEGAGAVKVAALGALCEGQRPAFAPSSTALAYVKASPDCSSSELRTLTQAAGSFVGGTDTLVTTSPAGSRFETASWRARTPATHVDRLGGADRIAVGIATSQWAYPETDSAPGAVIASAGVFSDSVIASPLAGQTGFPLLLNPTKALDSRVQAELARLLPTGGFIYVVGGPASVSDAVLAKLDSLGYAVVRLAGADRFTTSVQVAEEMDAGWYGSGLPRATAFLADGTNFPDALVSGPAASQFLAPVLLSAGTRMPASVKSYLDGTPSITRVYSVGGAAAQAGATLGSKSTGIVGADRYAVSQLVAKRFFPGGVFVGVASGRVFPDALTGGALMGMLAEPLMLVDTSSVPSTVGAQMFEYRAATDNLLVFGGTATVADAVPTRLQGIAGTQTALWGIDVDAVSNPRALALKNPSIATQESRKSAMLKTRRGAAAAFTPSGR